ncbi:Tyrosinase tyrosinase: common central domain containing protein [Ceratobasidium theobromae]|uniref:Tyrosinase tyrosinase: common central domain containing protein n=1 Tax=Ceratobasidium theobromae TaxID=1582974 RepID=A0A5N5QBY0_9AGAM|nr:Tyrosinase tyrosinase: common central domain containing protein [Ceratobasidium theobromae]
MRVGNVILTTLATFLSSGTISLAIPTPNGWSPHSNSSTLKNGACLKPAQRREWRTLSKAEQKEFVDAIKCMRGLPHDPKLTPTGGTPGLPPVNTSSSLYDDFVYTHMDASIPAHYNALFLPFHRWIIDAFRKALTEKCGYPGEIPYWNWTLDVGNYSASPVFGSDKDSGLGTIGNPQANFTVTDGTIASDIRPYPNPHMIQRPYTEHPYRNANATIRAFRNPELSVSEILNSKVVDGIIAGSDGNFTDFLTVLQGPTEQGVHGAGHAVVGGDMTSEFWSPNDPLFFLHHTMIDCIWAKWQDRSLANTWAFGGGLNQNQTADFAFPFGVGPPANLASMVPTVGMTRPVAVWEVMSTRSEYLCYECAW